MSSCWESLGASQLAHTASISTATTGRAAERVEPADRPGLRWVDPSLSQQDYIKQLNKAIPESMESLDNSDVSGRRWYGTTQAARKNNGETFQDKAIQGTRSCQRAIAVPRIARRAYFKEIRAIIEAPQAEAVTLRPNSNGT